MDRETFYTFLWGWAILGLAVFILLLFVKAPYGRHSRKDWGPNIPNRLGWFLMEFPSLLVFVLCFLFGPKGIQPLTWIFFALYVSHYTNRSLIWPWRTRTSGKQMPLVVALMAVCFNLVNGFINGYYFSAFAREYTMEWLTDSRFIIGCIALWGRNLSELVVRPDPAAAAQRREERVFYPQGRIVSLDLLSQFPGEILQWTGFAVMTWSPAALVFALWTFFNLVPRALDHHKWYRETFPEYPAERKAIIPYIL